MKNLQICIAGAGLLGRLLAFTLVQQGTQITLFDEDSKEGKLSCGMTAAGMLTPFAELDSMEPSITEIGIQSLKQWPIILKQLKQPVYFQQAGSLMLAHAQDRGELERFKLLYKKIWGHRPYHPSESWDAECYQASLDSSLGWNDNLSAEIQILNSEEIKTLEPGLKHDFQQALYFPSEAQLCPKHLFSALRTALEEHSVTWYENTAVTEVKPYEIYCEDDKYSYDWIFDCRGLGAKPDQPQLRGVRGELIELYAPDVHLNRIIRLMHPRYALYIAPRPEQRFIIGASSIESEDKSPISVQTTLELLSAAYSLHPGFAEARILETRVNCRPAFPDNLPRVEVEEGLTCINGLYRHGYLLAPCLVEEAIAAIKIHRHKHDCQL